MNNNYQICNRCVLDTSEPTITFDENGVCHFCNDFDKHIVAEEKSIEEKKAELQSFIEQIRKDGKGKEYDCIIGVSGGVDSSYVALLVKEYGLRPLAVHLDNGWDDELAVKNIENICKILDIDLYTHVINWEEFKDLQLSFLKASVANAEAPTDHAIFALLYKMAIKYKVKWIIDGVNNATEFSRPTTTAAGYRYDDLKQIIGIHRIFGNQDLKTYPSLSISKKFFLRSIVKIKQFSILNYISYNKEQAKEILIEKLGWRSYGAKHHESLYTKWHQVKYLPHKFGYDKRRLHLSDMILSGQITREEALDELKKPPLDPQNIKELERYVMKKLDITELEYQQILDAKPNPFSNYPNNKYVLDIFRKAKLLISSDK
ncbi:N-acetyl sugar amidotransferase [Emticicia sp. SJ17W-69]|uniref:N-acetyl sugar amidotransferase n=1 Tax=Emticicia sp. SJ17W-69 TaxID=3421657 RepID=UPI003EBDC826